MNAAPNRIKTERFNQLGRVFLRVQEAIASNNRETALLALRLAREELDEVIKLVEGK